MGLFELFAHTINTFILRKKESIKADSDLLLLKKRALFHDHIPDLKTIKTEFGEQYSKLKSIVDGLDPIAGDSSKKNPKKYELLVKTLIYQLKNKRTQQEVYDLIQREFNLWFGHAQKDDEKFEKLLNEVYEFKLKLK
ncbi:MAG: hypothetical protein L6Q66_01730 [Bacteroidia bacterium]|nr:hypothetical protein [Bacteroidia bacterium]